LNGVEAVLSPRHEEEVVRAAPPNRYGNARPAPTSPEAVGRQRVKRSALTYTARCLCMRAPAAGGRTRLREMPVLNGNKQEVSRLR